MINVPKSLVAVILLLPLAWLAAACETRVDQNGAAPPPSPRVAQVEERLAPCGNNAVDVGQLKAEGKPLEVSIEKQECVLIHWDKPFSVAEFQPWEPPPDGRKHQKNPFARPLPFRAAPGEDGRFRVNTGPPFPNQDYPLKYRAIVHDEKGNPIDPPIDIVR